MSKLGRKLNQETLVLRKPLVTEKSTMLGVHTFEVAADANKSLIKKAFKSLYQVTPRRVNIVNLPRKKIVVRGKIGYRPGMKKAVVYLKAGDKLTIS